MQLIDENDQIPQFVGRDTDGKYATAVSETTVPGDFVIKVTAIDLDGTSPNNLVSHNSSIVT